MAKYRLQKSNNVVSCEVLNESDGQYVVRFGNGVIQKVPRYRVFQLDHIDEGVLDALDEGKIADFGRKVAQKVKGGAKRVMDAVRKFLVDVFVVDDFVLFRGANGSFVNASHPINSIEGAQEVDSVNYIPGSATAELCQDLGMQAHPVENFLHEGVYNGAMQWGDIDVNESYKLPSSLMDAVFEEETEKRLPSAAKIHLEGTFCDWTEDEIVDAIYEEWLARCAGMKPKTLPLLIWGAPGIGKTAIIRSLRKVMKTETGASINIISVNGGNIGPDDFTMPASITKTLHQNDMEEMGNDDFKGATKTEIKDLPKSWLPLWDATEDKSTWELANAIANGGGLKKDEEGNEYIENGPGGIFFIDEYSRMTQAGMDSLMQTPTTREIGSSSALKFGDRWVIICAANRMSDMGTRAGSEVLKFEGASKTRFNHCNFVPDPKLWLNWADEYSDADDELETIVPKGNLSDIIRNVDKHRKNIIPEVRNYIAEELRKHPKDWGDFYEMAKLSGSGDVKGELGSACPRTWEAASWILYLKTKFSRDMKYKTVSSMPKKYIVHILSGIIGGDVANRFASFVAEQSLFNQTDAENVWTKGDNAKYEIIKQQKLNSANIEEFYKNHIFPLLKDCYPGGLQDGVSPEAALNFLKFLEMSCWDGGKFNLNRFKTISTMFGFEFNVDLRSVEGPYADAANFKEDVVAKNELV